MSADTGRRSQLEQQQQHHRVNSKLCKPKNQRFSRLVSTVLCDQKFSLFSGIGTLLFHFYYCCSMSDSCLMLWAILTMIWSKVQHVGFSLPHLIFGSSPTHAIVTNLPFEYCIRCALTFRLRLGLTKSHYRLSYVYVNHFTDILVSSVHCLG